MASSFKVSNLILFILIWCSNYCHRYCHAELNVKNISNAVNFSHPVISTGGWTPMPAKNSILLSDSSIDRPQTASAPSSHSGSQKNKISPGTSKKQRVDASMLPIPVIKPHAHGATLGFDLPEQGLTLYLDIDELATKPLAQNIGLKVVTHDRQTSPSSSSPSHQSPPSLHSPSNKEQNSKQQQQPMQFSKYTGHPKPPSSFMNKPTPIPVPQLQKRPKPKFMASYEGNVPISAPAFPNGPSMKNNNNNNVMLPPPGRKYHIGFIRPSDLHNALKQVGFQAQQDGHQGNNNNHNNGNQAQKPQTMNKPKFVASYEGNVPAPSPQSFSNYKPMQNVLKAKGKTSPPGKTSYPAPPSSYAPRPRPKPKAPKFPGKAPPEPPVQKPEEFPIDEEVSIISTTPQTEQEEEKPDVQQQSFDDYMGFDIEPQKQQDDEKEKDNLREMKEMKHMKESNEEMSDDKDIEKINLIAPQTTLPTPSTNAHFSPPQDNAIVRPFPAAALSGKLTEGSCSSSCQQSCAPIFEKLTSGLNNIKDIASELKADEIFNLYPSLADQMQTMIDFTAGYTMFLPSNDAISRLPQNLVDHWKNSQESLNNMFDNHILETAQSLEDMRISEIIQPRSPGSSLRINSHRNETYTVNGQRITMADQQGPEGGMIHVIDGILYPTSDKDIMETLKSCNKFDGFVTLAEGTGFFETLKESGPFTVFVPSNEALQKVPDSDLDIIRHNMTALKEFLKYHVAKGSFYSNDLRDGQFIPSLVENHPIQVGVRVDACSRRLVEANVSPLYRADIPASNGVIHVVDWVLKPDDREWCDGVILPR